MMKEIIICIIIFVFWTESLYYRTFDKSIRRAIVWVGVLSIFWMLLRVGRGLMNDHDGNILWYLYYAALIYIPTIYSNIIDYLAKEKNKIKKYVPFIISGLLLIFILTNNVHNQVFIIKGFNEYEYNYGFYLIFAWIIILTLKATIKIMIYKRKMGNKKKWFYPFIVIIIGSIYSYLYNNRYIADIKLLNNLSFVMSILYFTSIECIIKLGLIPTNKNYLTMFKKIKSKGIIVNNNGKICYHTSNTFDIPSIIADDIRKDRVKNIYRLNKNNYVYTVSKVYNGYFILFNDNTKINKLKQEIKHKNQELRENNKTLKQLKCVKEEFFDAKAKKIISDDFEKSVTLKINTINKLLNKINNDDIEYKNLSIIKLYITYLKRMSYLITSSYEDREYSFEEVKLFFHELFNYADELAIDGIVLLNDDLIIKSKALIIIYDVVFTVIKDSDNLSAIIDISEADLLKIRIKLDKKIVGLKKKLKDFKIRDLDIITRSDSLTIDFKVVNK